MFRPKKKKRHLTQASVESSIKQGFKIEWGYVLKYVNFDEAFLEKHIFSQKAVLANSIIHSVIYHQDLSESLIEKHLDLTDYYVIWAICNHQKLSEGFIRKHFINKNAISSVWSGQKVSEDFIEEFLHFVNWRYISRYQDLSNDFIERHNKSVYWSSIFACQAVSPDIILKYSKKFSPLTKRKILENKKIKKDAEFISKLGHIFDVKDLEIDSESALGIIKNNRIKFNLDDYLAYAGEAGLRDLAKFLVA